MTPTPVRNLLSSTEANAFAGPMVALHHLVLNLAEAGAISIDAHHNSAVRDK
jgi:hypothetical protein